MLPKLWDGYGKNILLASCLKMHRNTTSGLLPTWRVSPVLGHVGVLWRKIGSRPNRQRSLFVCFVAFSSFLSLSYVIPHRFLAYRLSPNQNQSFLLPLLLQLATRDLGPAYGKGGTLLSKVKWSIAGVSFCFVFQNPTCRLLTRRRFPPFFSLSNILKAPNFCMVGRA